MELDAIRKQLDKLDRSLDYIILLRMSLAVLVGKVKDEKGLPIYQADREKKIYDSQKAFSEHTGVNSELLVEIYQKLIGEAVRIEENLEQYPSKVDGHKAKSVEQLLDSGEQALSEFIALMDSVKDGLNHDDIRGREFFVSLSNYYESKLEQRQ